MVNIKKIVFIIPYRGIGDIIFHIPIFKSLFKEYNLKFTIITNKANKADFLIHKENYIEKIVFENFDRENFLKNSINLIKKVNSLKADLLILTHGSKRLVFPMIVTNAKEKIFFGRHKNQDLAKFLITQFKENFKNIKLEKNYSLSNISVKTNNSIFFSVDTNFNHNNWGEDNFIDLINILRNKYPNFLIYINVAPHNKKYFKRLIKCFFKSKNIYFTDNYSFDKIIKLISQCSFMIGNESGPACIAALLKKKTFSFIDRNTTYQSSKTIYNKVKFFPKNISVFEFIDCIKKSI